MLVTLLGLSNITDVKLEHPEKALSPIVVTLLGIVIDVKLKHPENAIFPILITLFGIIIDVRFEQFLNA